jgi:hypothetical protein
VCATYLLARVWYDALTATLAALLLALSGTYFSNAGVFLADLPVAALGVLCAWLAARERYWAYVVSASVMVLIKESAIVLVVALAVYPMVAHWRVTKHDVTRALAYAAPLLAIGAFAVVQRVATGRFFYIYDFEVDTLFVLSAGTIAGQAARITRWLFIDQYRWVFTAATLLNLVLDRTARRRHDLVLLALAAVMSGYSFAVLFYAQRYVLPVMPFFYIAGAASIVSLARGAAWRWATAGVAVAVQAWSLASDPPRPHAENNLDYLRAVALHSSLAATMARAHGDDRIVTSWPLGAVLSDPFLGYVERPLRVVWYERPADLQRAQVVLVASPANSRAELLRVAAVAQGWRLRETLQAARAARVDVYVPP